ncbi:hypothetical protein IV203_019866 [Nitzschia inconspicua]|uniref:Uncharacterized protein n=1 Tax=Nitzschia inconspicua TaxID=303405 RepID=A0A9K3M3C3_9STRA|nr:hypothetical protein IV203_019866 [Nitzschia inconspicua]
MRFGNCTNCPAQRFQKDRILFAPIILRVHLSFPYHFLSPYQQLCPARCSRPVPMEHLLELGLDSMHSRPYVLRLGGRCNLYGFNDLLEVLQNADQIDDEAKRQWEIHVLQSTDRALWSGSKNADVAKNPVMDCTR